MVVFLTESEARSTQRSRRGPCTHGLQSQEDARNSDDTANGREETHGNVWYSRLNIVFPNVFEVEVAIEPCHPTKEGDEHLGQRRVNVHEELAMDVLGREATEAVEQSN